MDSDGGLEDDAPYPPYPASGRREEPMYVKPSPWPWVIGAGVLVLVLLAAGFILVVAYVIAAMHP